MPDDLLDLSDSSGSSHRKSSRHTEDRAAVLMDDPDVYCSVASGDFDDSESLKRQLAVVEAELKLQVERNLKLSQSLEQAHSRQSEIHAEFEGEKSRLINVSDGLRAEVESLRGRISEFESQLQPSEIQDTETIKKQFDHKLKDVMEKAREHAKKIANERDDFRKQVEDKETKLLQFKQLMNEAKSTIEVKDSELRQFQSEIDTYKSKYDNLNLQISKMESHYTNPPNLTESSVEVKFEDTDGTEWVLTQSVGNEKSWWRVTAFTHDTGIRSMGLVPQVSVAEINQLKLGLDSAKSELANKMNEFEEYKKRAESLLSNVSQSVPSDSHSSAEHVRKLMKAEEEMTRLTSTVSRLGKRISQLESVEKSLRTELDDKDRSIDVEKRQVETLSRRVKEIEIEREKIVSEITAKDETISELRSKIRELNSERAVESLLPQKPVSASPKSVSVPTVAVPTKKTPTLVLANMGTQTIDLQVSSAGVVPAVQGTNTSYHDSVVIPLRNQIRSLIEELESEKHQHDLTKEQLLAVKEALRKVESDSTFASDLTDPTKIEYMRNVGRKFFSLVPHQVSEELEQILPVMLSLFQLPSEEVGRLLTDRRQRAARPDSGGLINSFSIPKLW